MTKEELHVGIGPTVLEDGPKSGSRRVSYRVSLRWKDPKADVNKRKDPKASENAKLLEPWQLSEERPRLLGFLETRKKTPCLPAIFVEANNRFIVRADPAVGPARTSSLTKVLNVRLCFTIDAPRSTCHR